MYYAIIAEDVKDSLEKRKSARAAHLKRLTRMAEQKRILLAGPHPASDSEDPGEAGFSGSLIVRNSTAWSRLGHGPRKTLT